MIDPKLPFIDLHRHLDGNVRLETILELSRKHNLSLPAWTVEELRPYVQVTEPQPGVMDFIGKFAWMTRILVDYDACRQIACENVLDARAEGLDYVELRFSPSFMAEPHALEPAGVVEAVTQGVQEGCSQVGIMVNLIGIISRTYGPGAAWQELNGLLQHQDEIVALDLAGDEENYPGDLFVPHMQRAREQGWQITIHAGEAAGPRSIWQAITELGAVRIGHAVHAPEDPALIQYMADHRIGIEANLTSNVQTSTVPDYASHPLKFFLQKGLLATINSDDPGISGINLAYEYNVAAPAAGLTEEEIRQAQANALTIAFLPEEDKRKLAARKYSADQA